MADSENPTFLYRYQWENEFQWKARQIFIETFNGKFEDRRLASLSNAWANWRFHGCIYCRAVQSILSELDSELPSELHAAINQIPSPKSFNEVKFVKPYLTAEKSPFDKTALKGLTIYEPRDSSTSNPISVIMESAQKSRKKIEFQDLGSKADKGKQLEYVTAVLIEETVVATGTAPNKKDSKRNCASNALEILRNSKEVVVKQPANHDTLANIEKGDLIKAAYEKSNKIETSNIGNIMLRKMGWTGDGGLNKTGISEPVFLESSDGRKGFGHDKSCSGIKRNAIEDALLRFIRESEDEDVKFSNELSKDERALIHRLCQKYGLKHRSFGKGNDRYLVVSKK